MNVVSVVKKIKEKTEARSTREITKITTSKAILLTLKAVGVLSIALMAPNMLQVIPSLSGDKKKWKRSLYYIPNAVDRLIQKGLIEFRERNGKKYLALTEAGQQRIAKYHLGEYIIPKPWRWDRKWRVVIFDIREFRKRTRDELRWELERLGFVRLQDSVWVYPYDCEELMVMLKTSFGLGKDVLYMKVDYLENDRWLRKEFTLR